MTHRNQIAVGYIRCSTELQEESPEQQKKEIELYATKQGFTVTEWFVDFGKSGTTFDQRPEFERLRKRVESHPNFQTVICYDESRWGRAIDAEENTYWRVHFRRSGVEVLLVKTSVDPSHEFAPMLKAFEGVQASQYSKKLSELTLRGAKNNGIYSNGGPAPYGYSRLAVNLKTGVERKLIDGEYAVRQQEKVKWTIGDALEVKVVRNIFEQRVKGSGYILIVEDLNRKKVKCPQRGRWRNKDQKWSIVTVKTIIENPVYYGARVYNRVSMSSIQAQQKGRDQKKHAKYPHWKNFDTDWVIVENAHEAIVTKNLWERANSVNKHKEISRKNQYVYESPYLLSGLIICSRCGFAFQGWSCQSKGIPYLKYIDGGWKNKRICSFIGIPKEKLERFAIESVKETLADPITVKKIENNLQLLYSRSSQNQDVTQSSIEKELHENAVKRKNIIDVIEARRNGIQLDSLLERLEKLEREKKDFEERLFNIKANSRQIESYEKTAQKVANFVLNFEEEFERSNPARKKQLLKNCILGMLVDREKNAVNVAVNRIPAVTFELENLLQKEKAVTKVVTAVSSGGRT